MPTPKPSDRGHATLVGAGPGDPDLLTIGALRALQSADIVLYDKLVGPEILALIPETTPRIDVGKRCGRHAMSQHAINQLMLKHARRGAHVVRLKGGDPMVFGRAAEEIAAMRAAGFAVRVIPGVTTALAAAAALAVPLTHRGLARSLHFITAHGQDGEMPEQDWHALAQLGGTLAVYMGLRTLPALTARLLAAGLSPATPAIALENATLPHERRIPATLGSIVAAMTNAACTGPTIVLIGETIALAQAAPHARQRAA